MSAANILLSLMLSAASAGLSLAQDPQLGTWKLDEATSKISSGSPKFTTVINQKLGANVKVTLDGVAGDGKPLHNQWTGKFDGKDYPVTGDPNSDMRSYARVDDRTLAVTVKKDGKVLASGRLIVSPDGKRRTVIESGTDAKGAKYSITTYYDRKE